MHPAWMIKRGRMKITRDRSDKAKGDETGKPPPFSGGNMRWYQLILLLLFLGYVFYGNGMRSSKEISWQQFERVLLARKAVQRLDVVNNEAVEVYLRKEYLSDTAIMALAARDRPLSADGAHFRFSIGNAGMFAEDLKAARQKYGYTEPVDVRYVYRQGRSWELFIYLLPLLFLLFFAGRMMRRAGAGGLPGEGSIFSFGRSTARLQEDDNRSTVTFNDVAGLGEAKVEVREIVDFLRDSQAYTRLGAKIPKGVIIVGPPGTGKTLLVKAVAGEAQVPFFSISGSEFVEMFVGVGASRVRDLFRRAKEKAPCIVFIDEIDAVGRARGKNALYTGANDERESTLNQLLTEMDGFSTNSGVIVLAATNRADMLDPALLRPGRFDRHIYLELPDLSERNDIFLVHMRPLVLSDDVDAHLLAAQTPGFSGADIANICNEAALIAARRKGERIGRQDFLDAIDRVIAGLEHRSRIISPREKRIISIHEAGHAVVSWMLPHVDPLVKVSIIPRGKALGAAWYLPEEHQLHTATEFSERLSASLGGRAAEELVYGELSSGALDDLEKVTREAYMMVAYYGFDPALGHVSFYDPTGMQDTVFQKPYSEETARMIDAGVRKLVSEAYDRAKAVLTANRTSLERISEMLLKKEVVYREDIEPVLGPRTVAEQEVMVRSD